MHVRKSLWIWLNHTSTHVLLGLEGGGGQPGPFFGQSEDEVQSFLEGTDVGRVDHMWAIPLEPYGDLPEWNLVIVQQKPDGKRPNECYITHGIPSSPRVYPLWRRRVTPIESGEPPQQAIVLLRDENNCFHARVVDREHAEGLPDHVASEVLQWRRIGQQNHVLEVEFEFPDLIPPVGEPSSSHADWAALAGRAHEVEETEPEKRESTSEAYVRDSTMRNLFIRCFGFNCQVSECSFTEGVDSRARELVAEVHHIREWSETQDDSPFNLCVVCANHHRLLDKLSEEATIIVEDGGDKVQIETALGTILIERDMEPLRDAM